MNSEGQPQVQREPHGPDDAAAPRLVLLPSEDGLLFAQPFLAALSARARVDVLHAPGWGERDKLPVWLRTVDELSYLYLDRLEGDGPHHAVGVSFGAWILLEAATKSPGLFASLTLVSPVGVKLNGREELQFADLFAAGLDERAERLYGIVDGGPDLASLDDPTLVAFARAQEATARFGWEPHLHSPGLAHRLHRVQCPALVIAGRASTLARTDDYPEQLAVRLGRPARVERIDGAGHRVDEQAPGPLADMILHFIEETG
jgi:pimeloyl-ACP methyl ester carboxylesterase